MSHDRESAPEEQLADIVEQIFGSPPKEPKSVVLELTAETVDQFSPEERGDMSLEIFSQIAVLGARKLWGKDFSFTNMSRDNHALLQKYMNSMGVKLIIKCNDDSADPWDVAEQDGISAVKYLRISVEFI
jgi:hypothetical protein